MRTKFQRKPKASRLPGYVRQLFWDYPGAKISWSQDLDLVTRKILENGTWDSMVWLRQKLGDEALRAWILQRSGRGLDPRRLRYWELILDLPHPLVDQWVAEALENPWHRRVK